MYNNMIYGETRVIKPITKYLCITVFFYIGRIEHLDDELKLSNEKMFHVKCHIIPLHSEHCTCMYIYMRLISKKILQPRVQF